MQMSTLCVDSNYISNVHVTFVAMCVLTVRHHIMVRGLEKSLKSVYYLRIEYSCFNYVRLTMK